MYKLVPKPSLEIPDDKSDYDLYRPFCEDLGAHEPPTMKQYCIWFLKWTLIPGLTTSIIIIFSFLFLYKSKYTHEGNALKW